MTLLTEQTSSARWGSLPNGFDLAQVREDFPVLKQRPHGHRLVFLDSAASAQKPDPVIDAVRKCYQEEYANVHRGVYWLSARATEAFDHARETTRHFINAAKASEIVFVRGATEAINLVAASYGGSFLGSGDEIVISHMEHHSNIVPWQFLRDQRGISLKVAPIDDDGELILEQFEAMLGPRTKLLAITHVSNVLGTVLPVKEICGMAKSRGIRVLIDGCQAVPHTSVDVQDLDCDFYVFSGHKLYGPSGIGVLYAREELLEAMPPYQGGGEMISSVTFAKTEYAAPPYKFEAGTPNIAGAIGLGAAIDYVTLVGLDQILSHESAVLRYGMEQLAKIDGLRLIGSAQEKASVISFVLGDVHAHDVGTILDQEGVAVRTGHHCAQPVMERFGIPSTVRASLGMYNGNDDIDLLVHSLSKVQEIFG